jgi:hypothetical protein
MWTDKGKNHSVRLHNYERVSEWFVTPFSFSFHLSQALPASPKTRKTGLQNFDQKTMGNETTCISDKLSMKVGTESSDPG